MPFSKKSFIFSRSFLLLLGLAVIVFNAYLFLKEFLWGVFKMENDKNVTVTGNYRSKKKNQMATFNASVQAIDADKSKALEMANQKMASLLDSVKSFGLADEDIKTNNMNVYQQQEMYYDDGIQKSRGTNWVASIGLEVNWKAIDKANEFASMLASQWINDLYGPNFALDVNAMDQTTLLTDAINNATTKAEALAKASGRSLGGIMRVVEGYDSQVPGPIMFDRGMGGGGNGLVAGSTDVSKTVTVTYYLY